MSLTLLNTPPLVHLSDSQAFFRLNSDDVSEPNLYLVATVFKSAVNVGSDNLTPDASGNFHFELSDYFKPHLNPVFTYPDINVPFAAATGNYQLFGITFEQFYGIPPAEDTQIDIQEHAVIYGRIPKYLFSWFYRNYSSFYDFLTKTHSCLSFWPTTHYITKAQTEKLFFCNYWYNASGESLNLEITLHFSDGTSDNITLAKTTSPLIRLFLVHEFHVGYNALDLDTIMLQYQGQTLVSYDVEIAVSGTVKSAKYTYILDELPYPDRREFIFRNSLGGYDTFISKGQAEASSQYSPEIINVASWWGVTGKAKKTIRTDYDETVKCFSGFVSAAQMAAMPEFFESDDAYEIINGKLYPITFPEQDIVRQTDKNGLLSFEFEYARVPVNAVETISAV